MVANHTVKACGRATSVPNQVRQVLRPRTRDMIMAITTIRGTPSYLAAMSTGAATLLCGGHRPLAHAEHVTVGVLEPGTPSRTDLGDEVDGLWRLVLLENHTARGQVADLGLDVIDLEA